MIAPNEVKPSKKIVYLSLFIESSSWSLTQSHIGRRTRNGIPEPRLRLVNWGLAQALALARSSNGVHDMLHGRSSAGVAALTCPRQS